MPLSADTGVSTRWQCGISGCQQIEAAALEPRRDRRLSLGEFTSCSMSRSAGSEAERDSVSAQEAAEQRGSELR